MKIKQGWSELHQAKIDKRDKEHGIVITNSIHQEDIITTTGRAPIYKANIGRIEERIDDPNIAKFNTQPSTIDRSTR